MESPQRHKQAIRNTQKKLEETYKALGALTYKLMREGQLESGELSTLKNEIDATIAELDFSTEQLEQSKIQRQAARGAVCPNCGRKAPPGMLVCPYCNSEIFETRFPSDKEKALCPHCGAEITSESAFCGICGGSVVQQAGNGRAEAFSGSFLESPAGPATEETEYKPSRGTQEPEPDSPHVKKESTLTRPRREVFEPAYVSSQLQQEPAPPEQKICQHCGENQRPEAAFCYSCGQSLE